ncbi:hemagglutinin repeat-containing protein [Pseudomonas fluorescens]
MDVRQFAFLARQPSAAVKSRSHFLGLPKRGLALILANAMFWQPLLAQADGIVVSAPGTGLAQAGNGVPIVNIAAPNANGLSHNQFHDYNVGANGVILNNSTNRTESTQLGGIILGNPNFHGTAANIILNEVNGGSPSQLRGYTEVAGQSAHVIVANPYGISCNGCGFINTPQATLTTGKAVIENGQISRYQVDKGSVAIEGAGLNASNVDQFEIITRATTINAQIQAKKLTIVAGRNDVDARTLNATARAADGSQAPDLAIDSSALGGMYVGAVKLVGTEAGVGVRLSGDMVAGGDIQIDAAGNVVMGQTSAGTAVNVKAQSVEAKGAVYAGTDLAIKTQGALTNQQTLAAKDSITLDAGGRLTNNGIIEAGVNADNTRNTQGDVRLTAQALDNTGKTVIASRDLSVTTGELANQSGTLSAQRDAQLKAASLDNQNQGRILSAGSLGINADQLLNSQGGLVTSTGNLTAGIGQLINRNGELSSQAQVTLQLAALDNVAGLVSAGQSLSLNATGYVNNQGGRIAARQALQVVSDSLDNRSGELVATDIGVATGTLDNGGGRLQGDRTLAISSAALSNSHGTLAAGIRLDATTASLDNTDGKLTSDGTLTAIVTGQLLNQTGLFAAKGDARLTLGSLDNRQGNLAANTLNLLVNGPLNNNHGTLRGEARLDLTAGQVDNSTGGRISAGTTLNANVASLDQHDDGRLFGLGDVSLDLNGGHLNNSGGVINAPGRLLLSNLNSVDNQGGEISSSQAFTLAADTLNNRNAKLLSEQALTVRIAQALDNTQGLVSAKALDIHAGSLNNNGGTLSAGDGLLAQIDAALDNRNGKVLARTASVNSASLDNRQGLLQGDATLTLNSLGLIDNRQGTLFAGQTFDLTAGSLDNSGGKLTSDGRLTALISAQLLNQTGLLSALGQLQISAASLDNSAMGNLYSQAGVSLDLNHGHLNNSGGLIHAPGALQLSNLNSVDNSGGEISSAQALAFHADSLNNSGGKLLSEQGLLVRIDQALDNTKGLIAATGLDLQANRLVNAEGELKVRDDVKVLVDTALDNRQGKIVGATTRVNSLTLDNSKGLLQGDSLLTITNAGIAINRGGRFISGQRLNLNIGEFDNQAGEVSSVSDLSFVGRQLDNSNGGRLLANGAVQLTLDSLNNQNGIVRADGTLSVQGATVNNDGGRISSGAAQRLITTGDISNRNGELLSAMALSLNSASLDNRGGKLIGDGAVHVTTGVLNNQKSGRLTSADRLDLIAGQVDNRFDGIIASNKALTASITGLDQRGGGELYSTSELSLDMNLGALNNTGGLIHAPGQLVFKNLAAVTNQHGEISSEHAFTLAAQSLNNSNGNLLSDQAVTLKIEQALINIKGLIAAAGLNAEAARLDNSGGVYSSSKDLTLALSADLLNTNGEVSSSGASVVNAMTLNNRNGQVMGDISLDVTTTGAVVNQNGTLGSGQRLNISSVSLDNSQSGSLVSDGGLTVKVDGLLDNQASGSVLAKGIMDIQAGSVDNRAGRLSGQNLLTLRSSSLDNRGGAVRANQNLDLRVGHADNRDGVLNSKQTLAITGQTLINQGGLASAIGPVRLSLDSIDNVKGRIASQDDLDATVGVLNQQGGELVAQGSLTLNADAVDNRDKGLLAATKALKLKVGSIDNRAGEISSQQNIDLSGQRLDNTGGKLLAGTALELAMAQVINQAKGLVFAQNTHLVGASLDNTDGTVGAQRSLVLQLSAGLDNTRGKLTSEGLMELTAQRIDNSGGSLSSAGPLAITSVTDLINTGGTVESAQRLKLASASLDNTNGLLKSQGAATLTTGLFNNGIGGRVTSADNLELIATQLNNSGLVGSIGSLNANLTGLTQLGGAELLSSAQLNLDMHNGELVNAGLINAPILVLNNLAGINNQDGEISSQNAFTLAAKNLDNSNGKLISNQALTLRVEQVLANVKGRISAAGLDTLSTRLDNTDGLLNGRGEVAINATELMDNQRGSVIADGALLMTSAALNNRGGEIAGKAQVIVNAASLDNQKGQLISTEGLSVTGAKLDNRNGLVGATKALKLDVGAIDNRAGELTGNADVSITGQQLNNSDKGTVFAGGALSLAVDQLINRTLGELNGQRLTFTGTSLDNSGGKLLSQQPLVLDLTGDLDNSQGVLSSEDTLSVKARSLNNSKGSVSSAQGLSVVVTDSVNNQDGTLLTDGNLVVRSASLGNQQGTLSGKGAVSVTTGALNNLGGRLNSGDTLALTTGQLNNGGSIGGEKGVIASVTGLDQRGGKLFSNAGLSLDLNNGGLNNAGGLINAKGPLLLNNLNTVSNQDGEISSSEAFTLAALTVDNSNGKLLSNQGLTLRINQTLSNLKGLIGGATLNARAAAVDNRGGTLTSRNDLQLTSDGVLNNSGQGLISATQALTVQSADLNNQNGRLLGGGVTLNAMALDNTAGGLINSQGVLNLSANSVNTASGGEVSAKGAMSLGVNALAVAGGRIVGEQGVTLDLNNGDLDNHSGLIFANGPLTFNRLRDLNNQGGEVSSQQSFSLAARTLDNSAGKLISSQTLSLNAANLINSAKGLMSGWQGLNVSGGSLDNRNHGTLSSRNGAIDVRLTGALQNNAEGAVVSQGRLDISAASLDNRGNSVISSGSAQHLAVSGALVNGDGGLIESGATLDVQASTLANQATINAQQAFTFTGTDLTNNGGSLLTNGRMTLDLLGNLNNSGGKLASAGPLLLQRASQVYNDADGQIVSQGLLTLLTGGLNNSERGTIAGKERVAITTSSVVQNHTGGLIYSQDADVQLNAAGLNNAKGSVLGHTGLNLTVSGDVDNRGGTLASVKGLLEARLAGGLNNNGGTLQAQGLNVLANRIDNQGGRIAAQTGDAVVSANDFANANGGVYAKGLVHVGGQTLDNNAGQIVGGAVELAANGLLTNRGGVVESDSSLSVAAGSLDNQSGQLRALGSGAKTNFQIGGVFDNRNGRLETSNADLTLNVGGFQNQGGSLLHAGIGTFDIATANLVNAGGDVVTRGGLTLSADSWTNSSVIQAGRLTVNVNTLNQTASGQLLASDSLIGTGGNWNNDGLITSDGSANLTLTGSYGGNGRYSSVGTLGLRAAQFNVSNASSIAGGGDTTFDIAGAFENHGRVTSAAKMSVSAGAINNYATLGSTQALLLKTPTLLNEGGLIFSGASAEMNVGALLNNNNAAIYSLGNLKIGGWQADKANSVINFSSSIQSDGDFTLSAAAFENKRQGVAGKERLLSGDITFSCDSKKCYYMNYFVDEQYVSEATFSGAAATVTVAGDLNAEVGRFNNFASSVVAGGNINIKADDLENTSVSSGEFTRSRVYRSTPGRSFSAPIFASENGNGPVDAYADRNSRYAMEYYAGVSCDSDGGSCSPNLVTGPAQRTGYLNPLFGRGPEVSVPGAILALNLISDVRKYQGASSAAAVIQAGKTVTINAKKSIQNGDIKNLAPFISQGQQNGVAKPNSIAKDISVNAQLPPDLAQRQVNPLALPNFSLPSGQNGLFRLSASGASDSQVTQPVTAPQRWTVGAASIDLAQREQALPETQGRTIQLKGATQLAASTHQVSVAAREANGINAGFRAVDASGVGNADTGSALPGRAWGTDITRVDGIDAGHSTGTPAVNRGDFPGQTPSDRDPRNAVTTPGLLPLNVPGVSTAERDTRVSGNPSSGFNLPGITPLATTVPGSSGASGQTLSRVQGLPYSKAVSQPHKYLIETNPVLTDLKQFMSSDYLLAGLGYNPDQSAKRLGDGLYEQRLIQQAIVERTGQRFIDGQTSDEAVFRHLMDNAIRSKQALDLSVGVSLTGQQVAALTHDIVWLEEYVVNGEKVLVPVLYLAQADNRLAPNGSLIAGQDLSLIAGENLQNAGTLRATNNLSAKAGNDLTNWGLIEAGNRLDLLAGNNIVNKAGGIIAGRDVTLTAVNGDVINERSVTATGYNSGYAVHRDYLDNAARVEAANDLSISAGRDVANNGAVLQSGRDTTITAGRDVHIEAVEQRNLLDMGSKYRTETVTQTGASVEAGRDVKVTAGRDFSAIASRIDAKRDVSVSAAEDLSISSAADEQHSSSKSRKVTRSEDHISQVSSVLTAGGDVSLSAGKDLELTASRISGTGSVALNAQQDVSILSALDEDASFYSKKSKGSFGRSKSEQRESYDSSNFASVVEAGKDLTINASKKADGGMNIEGGRDVTVIGSQLKAGGDMLLGATGDIAVLSGVEEHGSYSKKTKSGFLGLSKSGKSQLKTTASQVGSELEAGNDVVVAAGNDVRLRASQISAENDTELRAGLVKDTGDINLISANDTAYSRSEKYEKKTGSISGGFIAISSAKKAGQEAQSSTSVGSQVSADRDATLQAERDINLVGSGISAGRDVSLNAGRDVNVVAAQNSKSERDWAKSKQTGVGVSSDANGVTFFAGTDRSAEKNRLEQQTAAASQVNAGQDVKVNAGRDIHQDGSDVKAGKDIDFTAGRNIQIDAARETLLVEQQRELERNGLSMTLNHNYGSTKDAVSGAGKGEDNVSKGSSTLKAVDSVGQFLAGPTPDVKLGNSKQSNSQQTLEQTNRSSTLSAGNDVNLSANNDVLVRGSQVDAGRDINIKGRDVVLDTASGSSNQETRESQSWGGVHGGTSGGFKIGVGGSHGVASGDSAQGSSTATQVQAGRDINLLATNDLSLIGTQASAGRDIDMNAGHELNVRAATNSSTTDNNRSSGGGEAGFAFGGGGIGVYVSVSLGKGTLEREGERQQEAYLFAGDRLSFTSGKDTNISGATLRGDEVLGRVGGDLNVSSAVDTGSVKGREFDVNATVTVGLGGSVSGSVGYGQTTGKTNWVEQQTQITGKDKVDIRTENHTQIDGALIAADSGKLKLDTGTLGFSDIAGKDKEHGYYLNVGGTYGFNSGDGPKNSQGKGEDNGWSVSGWNYEKDREQIVRATVGAGEVVVRGDAGTGIDSTTGLNRDPSKAYEITKDHESRTDLYASSSSLSAVTSPKVAVAQWQKSASLYGEHSREAFEKLTDLLALIGLIPAGAAMGAGTDVAQAWVIIRENIRDLDSKDPARRSQGVKVILQGITDGQLGAESNPLISRITDLGDKNPDEALRVLALLSALSKNTSDRQDFFPLIAAAAGVMGVLAGALATTTATPESQARLREAANAIVEASAQSGRSVKDQVAISAELWKLLYKTTFPADLLNDKNRALVNPVLEDLGLNPSSDGYGAGGQPTTVTNTGGSQVVDPKGTDYSNPVVDLPSSGNMYNSDGSKITYGDHAKIRSAEGRPTGFVVNDVQASRPSDILVQDDGRWVVKGASGRIHILEPDGEVVTSFPNAKANTNERIQRGYWTRASQEELKKFASKFSDYVRW